MKWEDVLDQVDEAGGWGPFLVWMVLGVGLAFLILLTLSLLVRKALGI